jgi:hypothetical protein
VIYTPQVRLNRNFSWLGWLAVLALAGTGCGGISASKSVSPASFFLPGLLKNEAACTNSAPFVLFENSGNVSPNLASVR